MFFFEEQMQNSYMLRVQIQDLFIVEEQEHDPYIIEEHMQDPYNPQLFGDRFLIFLRNRHKIFILFRCRHRILHSAIAGSGLL